MTSGDPDGPDSARKEDGATSLSAAEKARLRAMVDNHFEAVWRALRRFGVPAADVEDCAQQVFWVASRKLSIIAAESELRFLLGTATRVAADHRKMLERRKETVDEIPLDLPDAGPQPDQLVEQKRLRALLDRVLSEMPLDHRVVFVMFELEELSIQEIAEILEIPKGTVGSRLRLAREDFERRVARMYPRGGKS